MTILLAVLPDSHVTRDMSVMVPVKEDVAMMAHGPIQYLHVIVSDKISKIMFLLILFINLAVDCQQPEVPSNGGVTIITTTFGSTIMYNCDSGYALCGDDTRMCLSTGMWSGSVPDCISEHITRTSPVINVLLNRSCSNCGTYSIHGK